MSLNLNLGNAASAGAGGALNAGCRSIFGMLFGIVLIPAAFGLVYYGERKLVNHGIVWERTPLTTLEVAAGLPGQLVKVKGKPVGEFLIAPRYKQGKVVYWRSDLEQYKEHQDSEGKREYSWDTEESKSEWAPFKLGSLSIVPDRANPVGEERVFRGFKPRAGADFDPAKWDTSPSVGDQRLTVDVLKPDHDYLVMGWVQDKTISTGSTFVVSSLDEARTVETLKTEYKIAYWLLKGGGVLCLWMGLMALFGPLMTLVGWIPFVGERLSAALAFVMLLFSAVVVGLLTLLFKLFWVILAVSVLVIVLLIVRGITSPRQRPLPAPPPPAAS